MAPTRLQIEAPVALPTYTVQWKPSGSWVDISQYVIDVSGTFSATINQDNPMGFGDTSENSCDVVTSLDIQYTEWGQVPIRIYLGFNGDNVQYFNGIINERSRDEYAITLRCTGFAELVRTSNGYSPLIYARPAATRTTVSSIEDPTNSSWRAGIINFVLWQAGGRPADQDFAYPSAKFYYKCEQAIYRTDWQWVAGENLWEEALKLARASGGQLFQGTDGIVYYKSPLSFGEGSQTFVYTQDYFAAISEDASTSQKVGEIRCNYTPRIVRPIQEVYTYEKPTLILPQTTHKFICETQWPLYKFHFDPNVADVPGKVEQVYATFFNGDKANVAVSGGYLSGTDSVSAQRIELNVSNTHATDSMVVHKITLYGEPLIAQDQGSATYGTGEPKKQLEDNVYVQSPEHAKRICILVSDFYGSVRPLRHLRGCGFDPDRFVGEIVGLTYTPWGLSNAPHRIASINYSNLGATMDVDLVPITGLPTNGNFYIVGNSYNDGDIRMLSY